MWNMVIDKTNPKPAWHVWLAGYKDTTDDKVRIIYLNYFIDC